jgi:hypothetical protein
VLERPARSRCLCLVPLAVLLKAQQPLLAAHLVFSFCPLSRSVRRPERWRIPRECLRMSFARLSGLGCRLEAGLEHRRAWESSRVWPRTIVREGTDCEDEQPVADEQVLRCLASADAGAVGRTLITGGSEWLGASTNPTPTLSNEGQREIPRRTTSGRRIPWYNSGQTVKRERQSPAVEARERRCRG